MEAKITPSNFQVSRSGLKASLKKCLNRRLSLSMTPWLLGLAVALLSFMPTGVKAQTNVTIGTASTTNSYLPTYEWYSYTLSQQIYTASEIAAAGGGAGRILSISFYHGSTSATRTVAVYLKHTNKNEFSSTSDWVAVSSSDLVYQGSMSIPSSSGWYTVNLTTPFHYDGTSNLLLCVDDNTGSYVSSCTDYVYSTSGYQAMYIYSDGTNYSPSSPSGYSGTRLTSKNQIRLSMMLIPSCTQLSSPANGSNIDGSMTTLSWPSVSGATGYHVYLSTSPTIPSTPTYTTTSTSVAATGLNYGQYFCWVQPYNSNGEAEGCSYTTFTRPCPASVPAPTVTPSTDLSNLVCGQDVTLTTTGDFSQYLWYSDAACTQLLGEGSSYSFTAGETPQTIYCKAGCSVQMGQDVTLNYDYTGGQQTFVVPSGVTSLTLQAWGAQGGYRSSSTYGGKGGYATGTLSVTPGQTIYVNVGGSGNSGSYSSGVYAGGYNGGGYRYGYHGGGGATHFATASGVLKNLRTNQSAVKLVAGGGGSDGGSSYAGAAGGGTTGIAASGGYGSGGNAGNQTSSGGYTNTTQYTTGLSGTSYSSSTYWGGGFGYGGSGIYRSSGYGGAGGGGWYGGCGTYPDGSSDDDRGGGGGASYIGGVSGGSTVAGNASMPSPNGGTMTGRTGHGYARISYVLPPIYTYSSATNVLVGAASIPPAPVVEVDGRCPGEDLTLTVTNPVAGLTYGWWSNASCSGDPLHEGTTYTVNNNYSNATYYVRAYSGTYNPVYDFSFTGSVQTVAVPSGATAATLQVWGAQGGTYGSYTGGRGGYSVGTISNLSGISQFNVYVGGAGSTNTTGGWNGGGDGVINGRGGGGGTDIRVNGGTLYDRIIVAGGGGGAGISYGSANPAGCGGGAYGGDGYYNYVSGSYVTGANRSGGGATPTQGGISWNSITSTRGTFGQGGDAYNYSCGGGGGGWYGGGGAYDSDSDSDGRYGGGGSGYVWTSSTASNAPSGYNVSSDYYLTGAQTIAGNTSFTAPGGGTETGHTGNGYARITFEGMTVACQSAITTVPVVLGAQPSFTLSASANTTCRMPVTLTINNPSSDIVRYEWSDGTVSTSTTHTVTPGITTTYTVSAYNDYCSTEHAQTIVVDAPSVDFMASDNGECVSAGSSSTLTVQGGSVVPSSYTGTINMYAGTTVRTLNAGDRYHFYDNGGPTGNYSNSASYYTTFTAPVGNHVTLIINSANFESCCDYITIYNGTSSSAPQMGTSSGNSTWNGHTFTSTGNSLTVYFYSDGSVLYSGWEADVYCMSNPTYAWAANGEPILGATSNTLTVTPNETTTYTVTVSSPSFNCDAVIDHTVRVIPTVEVTPENPYTCAGATVLLTASGADNYVWRRNGVQVGTGATYTADAASYVVEGMTEEGCVANSNIVTVNELTTPHAGSVDDLEVCQSEYEITLVGTPATGGGDITYHWQIGPSIHVNTTTPSYTLTAADRESLGIGVFAVTRTFDDECGSSVPGATATLTINPPMTAPAISGETMVACGTSTTLTASGYSGNDYFYRWYSDPAGENLLHEGAEFTTPAITEDTVFYLQVEHVNITTQTTTFNYTGAEQVFQVPDGAQSAVLRVYGAQGGSGRYSSSSTYSGGLGGYATGTIDLNGISTLYVNVGGQGESALNQSSTYAARQGGYNGGGNSGYHGYSSYYQGGAGGGATHIATRSGVLSSLSDYRGDVLIVAGGGGGHGGYSTSYGGGAGGGVNGGTPYTSNFYGKGGTQSAGGAGSSYGTNDGLAGSFGQGGRGGNLSGSYTGGAGGGGGWYGGGGGRGGSSTSCYSAGGGSGYLSPMLTNTSMTSGSRSGNGYATIEVTRRVLLGCPSEIIPVAVHKLDPENPVVEVSSCEGIPSSLTVTNPIPGYSYVWSANADGSNPLDTAITFTPTVSGPTTYYVQGMIISSPFTDFEYTGSEQVYEIPAGVTSVRLEVWGAQGGEGRNSSTTSYAGGKGGYAAGTIDVSNLTALYVNVGGQGAPALNQSSTYAARQGGYNGGGNSGYHGYSGYYYQGGAGGGATHIATRSGVLSSLSGHQGDVLLVAGGGAGSGYESSYPGGYGGGLVGGSPYSSSSYYGKGGTQSAGGAGSSYGTNDGLAGTFGQGGRGGNLSGSYTGGAGGGGGWYGGGGGRGGNSTSCYSGGGGSGHAGTAVTGSELVAGNLSMPAPNGGTETGHAGNGFARITILQSVNNSTCGTDIIPVQVNPYPVPTAELTASSNEACNQEEIELSVQLSGDVLTHSFSEGVYERDGHYYVSPGVTTTYTLTASNEGCTITDEVTIHVASPEVTLSVSNEAFCLENGADFTLQVEGASSNATGADNYDFSVRHETFQTLSGGTTCISGSDDSYPANIPIGFTFNYCGTDYTTITQGSSNGFLQLGGTSAYHYNQLASGSYYNILAPFWDDLYGTTVKYQTTGTAPNRVFTFQHYGYQLSYSSYPFYYQVKLYEGSNKIEFWYGSGFSSSIGSSASIGINSNVDGQFSFISVTPTGAGTATTSTVTGNDNITGVGASYLTSGTVYAFEPRGQYSYSWNTGDETESITVNPTEDQTYTVTVSAPGYNCDAVLSYNVHVNPDVEITSSPEALCAGGSVDLTASGAESYEWSTGENGSTITVDAVGTYLVTGTSAHGCSATGSHIVTEPIFNAGSIATTAHTVCASETQPVVFSTLVDGVSGGYSSYRWLVDGTVLDDSDVPSFELPGSVLASLTPGQHVFTREFQNGCDNTWTASQNSSVLTVVAALPQPVIADAYVSCGTHTTLSVQDPNPALQYCWFSDAQCTDLIHVGTTLTTPDITEETTYYVQAYEEIMQDIEMNYSSSGSYTYTVPEGVSELTLQVWGAQGGNYSSTYQGGKGGYAAGTLAVTPGDVLHVYVGGQPSSYTTNNAGYAIPGGYNGGGNGRMTSWSGTYTYAQGGGGATDIRLNGTSLYDRIIVAGGGSGASNSNVGWAGGGTTGAGYSSSYYGTQSAAGSSGSFGQGANSVSVSNYRYCPAGGGGGWYGGGSYQNYTDSYSYYREMCGGGSGYVNTAASYHPSGYHFASDHFLTNTSLLAGNQSMPSPTGSTMTGRTGSGYARISGQIRIASGCPSVVLPVTVHINPDVAPTVTASNDNVICGTQVTLSVENPDDQLIYQWSTDPAFGAVMHEGATYTTMVGGNTTYYVRSVPQATAVVPVEFSYTGSEQTYEIPNGIHQVRLEVWGAQGGQGGPSNMGGRGGYSDGTLEVEPGQILYVHVGGQGGGSSSSASLSGSSTGGYNGGGAGYHGDNGVRGAGGGATHIATASGLLSTLSSNRSAVKIVAGGGGGNLYFDGNSYTAGAGGGLSGVNGERTGGTQSGPGTDSYNNNASFGQGSSQTSGSTVCGGGGGWYGGGAGNAGSGGSGYIDGLIEAQTIAGNLSMPAPDGNTEVGHPGNGYARIIPIGMVESPCISEAASITITTSEPEPVQVEDVTVDCGMTAHLEVSNAVNGLNYNWYADPECTQLVHTGATWDAPNMGTTTTFYVRSFGLSQVPGTELVDSVITYNGNTFEFVVPMAVSEVALQAWGAQGGSVQYGSNLSTIQYGGKGGYAAGTLAVEGGETLYVNVGGQGENGVNGHVGTAAAGGFNGGGYGGSASTASVNYYPGAGGGGATDIRLGSNMLEDRLLVAGGGGGAAYANTASTITGGAGGGLSGVNGTSTIANRYGRGATSSSAGAGGYNGTANGMPGTTSGQGGSGGNGGSGGSGGGGGYYGGGGGASADQSGAGGGGSGYVGSSLTHTSLIAGDERMPSPTGGYTYGRAGNGVAIISYLRPNFDTLCLTEATPVTVTVQPLAAPELTDQEMVCGTPVTLSVNNPNASLTYVWYSDPTCHNEVNRGSTYDLDGASNTDTVTYYVKAFRGLLASAQEGEQGFAYANDVQVFDIPDGVSRLTFEVWGADGGTRAITGGNVPDTAGGRGGYTVGTLNNVDGLSQLYIYVGGRGVGSIGGYNGGGTASASAGGGGGGATDVALVNAEANSNEHYNSRLIVAGGGGGSGFTTSSRHVLGGYGGGLSGGNGGNGVSAADQGGNGASQVAAGFNEAGDNLIGAFGTANTAIATNGGGGGGGWYGGASGAGANLFAGGGGGSGFVWTSESETNGYAPASYVVDASRQLINTTMISGNDPTLPAKPVDTKNGYVLIHYYYPEQYQCESSVGQVQVLPQPIDLPDAWSVNEDMEWTDVFCSGQDILLTGETFVSEGDFEEEQPMLIWYNEDNEFLGASESLDIFSVLAEEYGTADYAVYYAYAATDLVSLSGSFDLSTGLSGNHTGSGVFVDVTANADMTIDSLSFYPRYGGNANAQVYYRRGSCMATATHQQGWNLIGQGEFDMVPRELCTVPLNAPVNIHAGETFTFYILSGNDLYYRLYGSQSNNTAGIVPGQLLNQYSTSALSIHAGYGTASGDNAFSSTHGNFHFLGDIHYTLYGETQFGCVSQDSYYVEVYINAPSSIEGMSIQSDDYVCNGQSVELTAEGGMQGTDAVYEWRSSSCDDGTLLFSGEGDYQITVTPTQTTTYYVRFDSEVCGTTECVDKTVYVLDAPVIDEIAAPEHICAGSALNIDTPHFVTFLDALGVTVDAQGWQISEDGVNYEDFTVTDPVMMSYNDWYLRYFVTTDCVTGYSNVLQLKVDSLPEISEIPQPDPICGPSVFPWDTYQPTVNYHNNSGSDVSEGWKVMVDGVEVDFSADREFNYGPEVKAWYFASNGCGEVHSDTIQMLFMQAPTAEDITALDGAVCAGQPLAILPPVTHEFGGTITQGWEYTMAYGSNLYTRFPADTIIDYGMNLAFIRYYIGNECGSMTTNSVQLLVNDVPTVSELLAPSDTYCSGDDFNLDVPTVLSENGEPVTGSGWYLSADSAFSQADDLVEVDVENGIDADLWNGQWLRHADTNACGVAYSNAVRIAVYPSHHLTVTPEVDTVCLGPTYELVAHSDIAGATFAWEASEELDATTGATVHATPAAPGQRIYTVTATESEHGCAATVEATLQVFLYSKDTAVHICASDLDYVFDAVNHPDEVCTQSGNYSYHYTTADGCDSIVNLTLTVTYPIERATRIHYCNYSPEYVWPVTGERLGGPTMKDTTITREVIVPCVSSFSDIDNHQCDSIIYTLEFNISNEPFLDVPVTDVVVPVGQTATAAFNVRKDCDFPGAKLAIGYQLYKDDTLIERVEDYGQVSMSTYSPVADDNFGAMLWNGTGELPGNTYNMYNYNYDYFYADYMCSVDNTVTAMWNEPGEYRLQLVVLRKASASGMDYAYVDEYGRVLGGAGSWQTDSVLSDTVFINFHVGPVDTMPVQNLQFCESELPQYLYDVEFTESGYYEVFNGNEGSYQMYPVNVEITPTVYHEFSVELGNCVSSYVWNNQEYYSAGDYEATLPAANGCDSVVTMHLSIGTGDFHLTDNVTACGSYTWIDGQTYTTSGNYTYNSTYENCPAVYELNLTISEPSDTTIEVNVAPMQLPYAFDDDNVFDQAGNYDIVLPSANGCDSIIHLNIVEVPVGIDIDTTQFADNLGDTAIFSMNVNGAGLSNRKVCIDYEITRNGEVISDVSDYGSVYFSTYYADIQQNVGRNLLTGAGSIPTNTFRVVYYRYTYWYLDFLTSTTNHLTAQWNVSGEYKIKFFLREREGGEDYMLTYNSGEGLVGGGGATTLAGELAVDSVVMHYEVVPTLLTIDTTICESQLPFTYHDHTFTEATAPDATIEFSDPYHIYDTVVTFTLHVNPEYALYDTAYLCAGEPYADNNFDLSADTIAQMAANSDRAVFTLAGQTAAGCDSTVTLTLFVKPLPQVELAAPTTMVCEGVAIPLSASGAEEYTWSIDTLVGDNPMLTITSDLTVYVTGSVVYPAVSQYYDDVVCVASDSIELTVLPVDRVDEYEGEVCQGEPYMDEIFDVEAAKTQTVGIVDTVVELGRSYCGIHTAHLTLTVHPAYNAVVGFATVEDEVCEGYGYQGHGFLLSADSIETLRGQTQQMNEVVVYNYDETEFSCDSITELRLHILPTAYSQASVSLCAPLYWPASYEENDQQFLLYGDTTIEVRYTQETTGCDSIRFVTVHFDEMPEVEIMGTEVCANIDETLLVIETSNQVVDSIRWYVNNDLAGEGMELALTRDDFESSMMVSVYSGACVNVQQFGITTLDNPTVELTADICEGETYTAPNGEEYSAEDTYTWTVSGEECDTIYTLILNVHERHARTFEVTVDVTDLPFVYNGAQYETAGTYEVNVPDPNGYCDSLVTFTLTITDPYNGEAFITAEAIDDNSFEVRAFANTLDPETKVSINYSLYRLDPATQQNVLVDAIATECGGTMNVGTDFNGGNLGGYITAGQGNIPSSNCLIGNTHYDFFYLHFLNRRQNTVSYDFTVPGTYTMVFELMPEENGTDLAITYTQDGVTRRIGGKNSVEGAAAIASTSYTFTIGNMNEDLLGNPMLTLSETDVTEPASSVTLTCDDNDYDPNAKVAVRYTLFRDDEPLSDVVNSGSIYMSTYVPSMHNAYGAAVTDPSGSIPGNTFSIAQMYNYNYFYMNYLSDDDVYTTINATWHQPGNYKIVFDLLTMQGGSDLALTWDGTHRIGGKNAVATNTVLASATLNYTIESVGAPMGVAAFEDGSTLQVYPNPARDVVRIQTSLRDSRCTITDMNGQTIYDVELPAEGTPLDLNVAQWSAGVYFVTVRTTDQVLTQKLVITK